MILYSPLWQTMKEKGVSTYALIHKYNISNGTLYRIRQGKAISTVTLNELCKVLKCTPNDVLLFVDDEQAGL